MNPAPVSPSAPKAGRSLLGCGGAGCGFALLLMIVGIVLLVFGLDRKTQEAMPFAIITLSLSSLVGIAGLALLIVGLVKRRG